MHVILDDRGMGAAPSTRPNDAYIIIIIIIIIIIKEYYIIKEYCSQYYSAGWAPRRAPAQTTPANYFIITKLLL